MTLKKLGLVTLLFSVSGFAQNQTVLPEFMENQCRTEAKEIALKSYQSCVSVKKTEQIETLRKEYQARLLELKNEYDQKIKDLAPAAAQTSKASPKKAVTQSQQDMQPTIKLKKAKTAGKKASKAQQAVVVAPQPLPQTQLQQTLTPQEEAMTARLQEEMNTVTGEMEKLEVQEFEDPSLNIK